MIYRRAHYNEFDVLAELRKIQLIDEGIEATIDIDDELFSFFQDKMMDDTLVQWVAVDDDVIVATAGIIFYNFPPSFTNKSGKKGYVTNVYTRDDYRKQGIATKLLEKLVGEAKAKGVTKLWLGASTLGKPVYQKFGFREADNWLEMDL